MPDHNREILSTMGMPKSILGSLIIAFTTFVLGLGTGIFMYETFRPPIKAEECIKASQIHQIVTQYADAFCKVRHKK